jgi:hypothetical protein
VLSAAGLYALDHNVERLAEDHANARRLAEMLGNIAGIRIMNPEVETNIVFIDPSASGRKPNDIVAALMRRSVRMGTSYGGMIRAVTHLDVTSGDMETAAGAFERVMRGATVERRAPRLSELGAPVAIDVVFVVIDMNAGAHVTVLLADYDALLFERRYGRPRRLAELETHEPRSLLPGSRCAHADLALLGALDQPRG